MTARKNRKRYLATLAQADVFFLVAQGFSSHSTASQSDFPSPSAREINWLVAQTGWTNVAGLSGEINQWLQGMAETPIAEISDEYHRLFEGAIVCPLNETAYVRRDKGAIIGDLCGFYRAFGWQPRTGTGEKPDHLVHELQFVGVLLTMLAQAQHLDDAERIEIVGDAIRKFGGDHLADWLPAVVDNLIEKTRSKLFRQLACILRRTWEATIEELSIPVTDAEQLLPLPAIPTLGPDDDALVDSPYEACGFETAPSLVQIRQMNQT